MREQDQISQLDLLKAYADLQDAIIEEQQESEQRGFKTERQRAVYNSMKIIFDGGCRRCNTHPV